MRYHLIYIDRCRTPIIQCYGDSNYLLFPHAHLHIYITFRILIYSYHLTLRIKMLQSKFYILLTYTLLASAQSCPSIHVFGARETTVSPGYGSAGALIDMIKAAHPGTTSEAITYPACGGQSSCGGIAYGDSARQGTSAVATAVNAFHSQCPGTQLVLVGYSQVRWKF